MAERRIKLLLVIVDLAGGAGMFCRNLARGMKRFYSEEFEISLAVMRSGTITDADRALFEKIHEGDLAVHQDWRRFLETAGHVKVLRRMIDEVNPDVILAIHTHANLLVPIAAPGRRVILSVHGHLSTLLRRSITRPVVRWLIRRRYRDRLVVVPTAGVAEDLAANFGVTRTRVIPHGIDLDRVRELAAQTPCDLPQKPYIVALGRLVAEKDYPTLLRAFAEARGKMPHRLVIVGGGPEENDLRRLADELGIAPYVQFLGHRDNPYPHVAHAEFFVLSSISEGFGLSLVEAMALGRATISTDCPSGPREILRGGEFGMLVPPADPSALASAMLRLAHDPVEKSLYEIRSAMRAQDFALRRMTDDYRALLLDH